MMNKVRTIFSALCFCLLASVALSVAAQSAGYTKLNVKGRVQLEVPSDWTISDAEQRRRVKEFAEKVTGVASEHVASLSAQSYPAPSRVFVRVSFIPMEPPLTQADVRQEVLANKQQVLKDLADVWREESPTMWAGMAKYGMKEVGRPSFAVEQIGGQTALIILPDIPVLGSGSLQNSRTFAAYQQLISQLEALSGFGEYGTVEYQIAM